MTVIWGVVVPLCPFLQHAISVINKIERRHTDHIYIYIFPISLSIYSSFLEDTATGRHASMRARQKLPATYLPPRRLVDTAQPSSAYPPSSAEASAEARVPLIMGGSRLYSTLYIYNTVHLIFEHHHTFVQKPTCTSRTRLERRNGPRQRYGVRNTHAHMRIAIC